MLIIDNHIQRMLENNTSEDDDVFYVSSEKLITNMENGFVIITQLCTFLESFLNSILSNCVKYSGENLLKCSVDEKLEIIFLHYKKDLAIIKGKHQWGVYKTISKVRNEMIHFKKPLVGCAGGLPDFELGKNSVHDFFTREKMVEFKKGIVELADLIASELDLHIAHNVGVFAREGNMGYPTYVSIKYPGIPEDEVNEL